MSTEREQLAALGALLDNYVEAVVAEARGVPFPVTEAIRTAKDAQVLSGGAGVRLLADFGVGQGEDSTGAATEAISRTADEVAAMQERLRAGDYYEDCPDDEDLARAVALVEEMGSPYEPVVAALRTMGRDECGPRAAALDAALRTVILTSALEDERGWARDAARLAVMTALSVTRVGGE